MATRETDHFETLAIHAGQRPDPLTGAVMTPVYLTSTYAQEGLGKNKGFEYAREISEHLLPGANFHIEAADSKHAELFFYIYWLMTGVHALHVAIGVILITFFALRAWFVNAFRDYDTPVDLLGLYWHFVDIVWVFLFPLIYLVDRHS